MRKLFIALAVLGLSVALAAPAFCDQPEEYEPGYGHGGGWGPGQMMGPGYSWCGHMMGSDHHGWGMRGPDWVRQSHWLGWGPSGHGWKSMKPEQREKWEKMRADFQMETLEIRKQLAAKHMELETLWAQPNVDSIKVEKLSNEVAELEAELGKKRDKHLLRCRKEFGDQGWACPGGWR